jgi:hypothetical protein
MAKYLSADRAVRVNTDTPMLRSLMNSENLQTNSPYGQDSIVYRVDVKGTQKRMTQRSPTAKDTIYLSPIVYFKLQKPKFSE